MIIAVLALLGSFVPSVIMFLCLRKSGGDRPDYRSDCTRALLYGFLSTVLIVIAAFVLQIIANLAGLKKCPVLIQEAYKDFILAALVEEIVKFLLFKRVLLKAKSDCSWRDIVAFMVIVGMGFGLLEDVVYVIDADVITILVRGFLLMHGGYGFIMGYLYGKSLYTGRKWYRIPAIVLPFLLHGIYDFGLTPALLEMDDDFALLSVGMALVGLAIFIRMIVFFARAGKKEKYTKSLKPIGSPGSAD